MNPAVSALVVLGVATVLYATERLPLWLTALLGSALMVLVGAADFNTVFRGYADPVVFLVAGMMVVGEALFATGVAQDIGQRLVQLAQHREPWLLALTVLVAAGLSAFLNNTGTTAIFIPIVSGIAAASAGNVRSQNILLFVAFAANTGGMLTLVGSTPPLLAQATLTKAGHPPFGFFEFAYIGLPVLGVFFLYTLFLGYPVARRRFAARAAPALAKNASARASGLKKMCALLVLLLCVGLFASEAIPLSLTAVLGALLVLLLGCLAPGELLRKLDWNTILLLGGALGMANALDKSGAGKLVAEASLRALGASFTPWMFLGVVSGVGLILTQAMSNTATMAILAPIAVSICQGLGISPRPVLMALATTTAAAYATPVGTPPNSLVLVAGYRFRDYVLLGGLLTVLVYFVVVLLVPVIWPF
jgi:anion transporter